MLKSRPASDLERYGLSAVAMVAVAVLFRTRLPASPPSGRLSYGQLQASLWAL